jgi:beta-ureidopropionase
MSRIVRIVTSSLGTLEPVSPPLNLAVPSVEDNVKRAIGILQAAARFQPDLVLLPETFAAAGVPSSGFSDIAETVDGPIAHMLGSSARDGNMNVAAGVLVKENGSMSNRALVFGRRGELVGTYAKMHPVGGEAASGVGPGGEPGTVDLDIGRVGMAICFDINWPSLWEELAARRVDFACWLSAYDGGFPLRSYAWQHQYPIISSVLSYHARLYDITGEEVTLTSRWQRLGYLELNLDRELFHTDGQVQKLIEVQSRYGTAVRLKTFTEEHLFTLESVEPGLSVQDIAAEFQLEPYRSYIRRCSL